jgi:uncharacterized membrane protein YraQ (UPF0718 family)
VHSWLFRRWTMFNIGAQSSVALLCSWPFGAALGLHATCEWWMTILIACIALTIHAVISWREVFRMMNIVVDLQIARRDDKNKTLQEPF